MPAGTAQADELRALSRLAFEELAGVPGGIGQVHRAIAERAFRGAGPMAAPVRLAHHAIAGGVYAALRGATAAAGRGADAALAARAAEEGRSLSTSARGSLLLGVLQGLTGDELERRGSPLHHPMAVRVEGRVVPAEPGALAAAFPAATPRLVVCLHGLMETERSWGIGRGEAYGSRLARDLGCTPVYVRYNSGRHVSENGRSLAELLEAVVSAWPVEVGEIALVGHSMGGLVARSACHLASRDDLSWARRVRHLVSLGTPHLGAPVVEAVHLASTVLRAVPETRPLGDFLRRRSAGIRDLRRGSLVDEDWRGRDPDALRAAACREVSLLEGAAHCFVAATVTRSARHPVARLVGDSLVLVPSASGRGRTRRVAFEHGLHVGGAHHLALLRHPEVYERLREWLATPPAASTASSSRSAP